MANLGVGVSQTSPPSTFFFFFFFFFFFMDASLHGQVLTFNSGVSGTLVNPRVKFKHKYIRNESWDPSLASFLRRTDVSE